MTKKEKIRNLIWRIVAVVVIVSVFAGTWSFLKYILVDDANSYTRITMHEFYNQDRIDTLFMGASHCYEGINPSIADEKLGCNTFNLGSSAQGLDVTYMLLQEADEKYDIKDVYLDISYNIAKLDLNDDSLMVKSYIITDYMPLSFRKISFLLKKPMDSYANSFLIARRNWANLFSLNYIVNCINDKRNNAYKVYDYIQNGEERYSGKGYVADDTQCPEGTFKTPAKAEVLDLNSIDQNWIDNLKNIIKYCDAHDINLTLISIPVSSFRLVSYGNYDEFIDYVNELIKETGVDVRYIDYNLLKEEYLKDSSLIYKDYSHLNTEGAQIFTNVLCDYINGQYNDEDIFYPTLKEKYENMPSAFYGLSYETDENNEENRICHLIMNDTSGVYTKVTLIAEDQEIVVKDWDNADSFVMPLSFSGTCRIDFSLSDDLSEINSYNIDF